jgi:small subunit ribosomal protein S6
LETITAKLYEGMFLVDSALAASDWDGINEKIKGILEKFGAEIVSMKKWDERKLAYPVKGKSRGTYILVFFRIEGPKISEIERAVRLTEDITRVLILAVENPDEDYINKVVPAEKHAAIEDEQTKDSADNNEDKPSFDESIPEDIAFEPKDEEPQLTSEETPVEGTEEETKE